MAEASPRTCQALHYLVSHLSDAAGRTKLVKLLYLADLEARRVLGRPLTEMQYRWWEYGPWDEQFALCEASLKSRNLIQVETYPYQSYYGSFYVPLGDMMYTFADDEVAVLDYLVKTFGKKGRKELVEEIVYQTPPMKDAVAREAYGKPLRMEIVDNEDFDQHGIALADILEGERRLRAGLGINATKRVPNVEEVASILATLDKESAL